MTDATPGAVYGDDAKLYYSTTVAASNGTFSGSLTEADCVIDDTISSEPRTIEVAYRGAAEISEHVGKKKRSLSGTLMVLVGTPGTTYLALKTAFESKTLLHIAAATGDITHVGTQVTRFEGKIKSWSESRPDNGNVTVSFEIVRHPSSYYASTVSVTAS